MGFGMRLRRWIAPEAKASRTAKLIAFAAGGQPVWTPRDLASLAREGFAANAVVYRSVRMIAEAAASVPLYLFDGAREVDSHPLLALLARPNTRQCAPDLLEAAFGHLLVAGNAYVEAVSLGGRVRELHVLRPDRMKVVPGTDGWPEAYDYTVGGQSVRFRQDGEGPHPILHLTLFNPLNDHYGMSPLEAAAIGIDLHNAAGAWNKALLDNSACPSGALVYAAKDGQLTEAQFARLKEELAESFQGAKNAGRPLLLEGGLDWKAMALSPKDMDFIAAKHAAARDIALALGVPPMLLGIPGDNTYANYAEANRTFWRRAAARAAHGEGTVGLARACLHAKRRGAGAEARSRCGRGALYRARGAVGAGTEIGLSYREREARGGRLRAGRRRRCFGGSGLSTITPSCPAACLASNGASPLW